MKIRGEIKKSSQHWISEIPSMDLATQGRTKEHALDMMKDLLLTVINKPGVAVVLSFSKKNEFVLSITDPRPFISIMLARMRKKAGFSLKEMSQKLGKKSRNSIRQFEVGNHDIGIFKLQQIINSLGYEMKIELENIGNISTNKNSPKRTA